MGLDKVCCLHVGEGLLVLFLYRVRLRVWARDRVTVEVRLGVLPASRRGSSRSFPV